MRRRILLLLASLGLFGCESRITTQQSGCVSCHRGAAPFDQGLEVPHARFALSCVDCHGGDPAAETRSEAHPANPDGAAISLTLSYQELLDRDPDFLRFVNPTHPSVAQQSCGSGSPQAAAGAGCHSTLISTSELSVHRSLIGITTVPRFNANIQALRPPTRAVVSLDNQSFQSSSAPPFTYSGFAGLSLPSLDDATPADPRPYLDHFLTKACSQCHLGVQDSGEGRFRGTGCAACHMTYASDGISLSADPLAERLPGQVEQHRLVRSPPDRTCETCHRRSYRIGPSYVGWIEAPRSFTGTRNDTPRFGKPIGSFVIDQRPPDIHAEAGMICADCHQGVDVHGGGHLRPNMGAETSIECETCHGTFDAVAEPTLDRLVREEETVTHRGVDGTDREVPQVARLPASDLHTRSHDAAHAEMECYACHTAWMQNVLRLDRVLDLRLDGKDPLTGGSSRGQVSETVSEVSPDLYLLGLNVDGKIGTFVAEHGVFSVLDDCSPAVENCTEPPVLGIPGKKIVEDYVGSSSEGRAGLSFMPAFQHTARGAGDTKVCADCHPKSDGSNLSDVRIVYGFGAGAPLLVDASTRTLDLTQMIDASGTSTTSLGHLLARPLPLERIDAALAVEVD